MIESSRWTGVPHDLCDFALTSWADQTMLVLIPLMVALMTIHHFSRSRSVQVPISAARSWRMVCHGVSNALIGGEGSQSETQCQTGISNRSERQYDRLLGYAGGNICLRCSNDPAGLEDRDDKAHSSCGASSELPRGLTLDERWLDNQKEGLWSCRCLNVQEAGEGFVCRYCGKTERKERLCAIWMFDANLKG
jgi:hypothetical protein